MNAFIMDLMNTDFLYWHWWLFSVVLFIIEVIVPGTFFLWMGVSALIVGALAALFPSMETSVELLIFSLFSVVSVVVWKKYQSKNPSKTDHPTLNQGGAQYIGRVIQLSSPIVNGFGKEKVGASFWTVRGLDANEGAKVKIIAVETTVLVVEPVDEPVT
ncbi:MAG: NfeD family protein [Alphaproteobacteria bacterium]|nr:NfeD family protein [Alphaproteobacteria bacterium]